MPSTTGFSLGKAILTTDSPLRFSYASLYSPSGPGNDPLKDANGPGCGAKRTGWNPGSSGWMPHSSVNNAHGTPNPAPCATARLLRQRQVPGVFSP